MEINCTEKELFVFKKIAHAAEELKMPCYIIGGFVRDKILGRKTKDADIVCVGDGISLAHETAKRFNHKPFVAGLPISCNNAAQRNHKSFVCLLILSTTCRV